MNTPKLLIAGLATLSISGAVNAAPSNVEELVSRFVSVAISATTKEIKHEISESILNSAHNLEPAVRTTSVKVTELSMREQKED